MSSAAQTHPSGRLSTLGRLQEAADRVVDNLEGRLTIDAVAEAAGVSRTTAYRLLGSNDELAESVATRRIDAHRRTLLAIGRRDGDIFEKIEAMMVYTLTEFTADRGLRLLLNDDAWATSISLRALAQEVLLPPFELAQQGGDLRDDIEGTEITAWLSEITLDMVRHGYNTDRVRRRFALFIRPALAPNATYVHNASLLSDAKKHADALRAILGRMHGAAE